MRRVERNAMAVRGEEERRVSSALEEERDLIISSSNRNSTTTTARGLHRREGTVVDWRVGATARERGPTWGTGTRRRKGLR